MHESIEGWLKRAKQAVEENTKRKWPRVPNNWKTLDWHVGPKFVKVTTKSPNKDCRGESAYMFIDRINGDVYKPASWSARAKGVRANIDKLDPTQLNGSGAFLYRR